MAKYYVRSGTMRTVVEAESRRKAAIWAVHQAMQQVLPIEGEPRRPLSSEPDTLGNDQVAVLSTTVRVSENGYGGCQETTLPILDVVTEWNEMVSTLDRLERMLYRAA